MIRGIGTPSLLFPFRAVFTRCKKEALASKVPLITFNSVDNNSKRKKSAETNRTKVQEIFVLLFVRFFLSLEILCCFVPFKNRDNYIAVCKCTLDPRATCANVPKF